LLYNTQNEYCKVVYGSLILCIKNLQLKFLEKRLWKRIIF